jgi:mono/diheme cytochrome c family protein
MKRSFAIAVSLVTVLATAAGTARADRDRRAKAIFDTRCASCHSMSRVGETAPRGNVELSDTFERRGEKTLRAWLRDPGKVKRGTPCTPRVTRSEIDILVAWIKHFHSRTLRKPLAVPPPVAKPPAPEAVKFTPAGQGRHR